MTLLVLDNKDSMEPNFEGDGPNPVVHPKISVKTNSHSFSYTLQKPIRGISCFWSKKRHIFSQGGHITRPWDLPHPPK